MVIGGVMQAEQLLRAAVKHTEHKIAHTNSALHYKY